MNLPLSDSPDPATARPASLDAFWMPFTANRQFKREAARCCPWRAAPWRNFRIFLSGNASSVE